MSSRTTKRFGSRYGGGVKYVFAKIEALQKAKYKCPYCHNIKVKRVSKGIWQCKKCEAKFTGKAYTLPKKIALKQEALEEPEAKEEAEEKPKQQKKVKKEANEK